MQLAIVIIEQHGIINTNIAFRSAGDIKKITGNKTAWSYLFILKTILLTIVVFFAEIKSISQQYQIT
jgi:hypothetical protein